MKTVKQHEFLLLNMSCNVMETNKNKRIIFVTHLYCLQINCLDTELSYTMLTLLIEASSCRYFS